jgi:MYND finger
MAPATNENDPPDGWALELNDAEDAYKQINGEYDEKSNEALLRLVRAQYKMRKFDDLKEVVSNEKGRQIVQTALTSRQLQELKIYQAKSDQVLSITTNLNQRQMHVLLKDMRRGKLNPDMIASPGSEIKNTNILQRMCLDGDIRTMEAIVALGAAIDLPFLDRDPSRPDDACQWQPRGMAPTNATVLALLCAELALAGATARLVGDGVDPLSLMPAPMKEQRERKVECAVQLVNLGADCSSKLMLPQARQPAPGPVNVYRGFGLHGKSVYGLGMMSNEQTLIDAMNKMKKREDKIRNAHCRCGSRLPWLKCHSGSRHEKHKHYIVEHGRVKLRYSPLANCPCNKNTGTTKTYFKCCWLETAKPMYQDDATATLTGTINVPTSETNPAGMLMASAIEQMKIQHADNPGATLGDAFGLGSPSELTSSMSNSFRRNPDRVRTLLQSSIEGRSGRRSVVLDSWDMEVYAGIMERIPNSFQWNDLHWDLESRELLKRVEEWNTALVKYCDDIGLVDGSERREAVLKLHTASPFAPCACPSCNNVEESVKQFKKCSRCHRVAYCSRECQRANWKVHKKGCQWPVVTF